MTLFPAVAAVLWSCFSYSKIYVDLLCPVVYFSPLALSFSLDPSQINLSTPLHKTTFVNIIIDLLAAKPEVLILVWCSGLLHPEFLNLSSIGLLSLRDVWLFLYFTGSLILVYFASYLLPPHHSYLSFIWKSMSISTLSPEIQIPIKFPIHFLHLDA